MYSQEIINMYIIKCTCRSNYVHLVYNGKSKKGFYNLLNDTELKTGKI